MDAVCERLTVWLAPLLPFTTEEAWTTRFPDGGSVCTRVFPDTPDEWRNDAEAERWVNVERVTAVVTGALERERREKRIGAALDAAPSVLIADPDLTRAFEGIDPAEVFRTSQAELVSLQTHVTEANSTFVIDARQRDYQTGFRLQEVPMVSVRCELADGLKCLRSWKVLPEVRRNLEQHGLQLTDRDLDAVLWWDGEHNSKDAA